MVHFHNTFAFQNLLKDEAALKIPLFSSTSSYNSFPFFISWTSSYFLNHPPFFCFVLFLVVLVTPFSKILESPRARTIFIMSFISSFEIIKVVVPEPYIFFWIPASIAEAAAVIPNGAKTFFAKGIATFINESAN